MKADAMCLDRRFEAASSRYQSLPAAMNKFICSAKATEIPVYKKNEWTPSERIMLKNTVQLSADTFRISRSVRFTTIIRIRRTTEQWVQEHRSAGHRVPRPEIVWRFEKKDATDAARRLCVILK